MEGLRAKTERKNRLATQNDRKERKRKVWRNGGAKRKKVK